MSLCGLTLTSAVFGRAHTFLRCDNPARNGPAILYASYKVRHLKTVDDLFASSSPRPDSLVAAAVQWAERIMKKIDGVYGR